jgi:hypothetical protein
MSSRLVRSPSFHSELLSYLFFVTLIAATFLV